MSAADLLKRAVAQLGAWQEKYGAANVEWLPPAGDVGLAEDIAEFLVKPVPEPDMRAVCEVLGFDPSNHHNAAICPYCCPKSAWTQHCPYTGGTCTRRGCIGGCHGSKLAEQSRQRMRREVRGSTLAAILEFGGFVATNEKVEYIASLLNADLADKPEERPSCER